MIIILVIEQKTSATVLPITEVQTSIPCDCYHDFEPTVHYLSLPTVNVLAGDTAPLQNFNQAEPCFMAAYWIAAIRGESPDGYVPPSTRYLCVWCKDHWARSGPAGNSFEPLK